MVDSANSSASPILYKYVSIIGLRRILEGSIRFTQPSAFNDPFELLPEIIAPIEVEERKIPLSFHIRAQRSGAPTETSEAIPEGFSSSDAMSRDIVQQLNHVIGILSLSEVKNSLLMWSHYADQYAGAVLGFDRTHDFFAGQIPIEYLPKRPRRHLNSYLAGTPIPVSELCVKSLDWSYEREVRVIRNLTECENIGIDSRGFPIFIQRLPTNAIKVVTLGERTTVPDQRDIYARIRESEIALVLAAVDHAGFVFREEIIKYPKPLSVMGPAMSPRTAHIWSELPGTFGELARQLIKQHPMSRIVNRKT